MGCGVPYALAAKLAIRTGLPLLWSATALMQMSGLTALIDVAEYWRRWSNPRLVVLVLNNRDLNFVTWEQRVMDGDPRYAAAQALPDSPMPRWQSCSVSTACASNSLARSTRHGSALGPANRPFVIDAVVDPALPALPARLKCPTTGEVHMKRTKEPSPISRTPGPAAAEPSGASTRQKFLLGSAAAASAVAAFHRQLQAASPLGSVERPVPVDPSREQGIPLEDTSYGSRSQFESEVRTRYATATAQSSWTFTPLQNSLGIITPSGLHFERSHAGTATIDPATHSLFIHGMVKRARKLSVSDLKRFPSVSRTLFIECSGNGLTEWSKPTLKSVQGTHGLTSTSEWTGVLLSTLLREAGVERIGQVDTRRRCGWGGDDPQHSDRQGDEGLFDRLRPERRGDPAGAGISAAPDRAGVRGQYAHQVAQAS